MAQLDSLNVVQYRGISGLELPRLASRVNLVTGVNGVGKTALAEAIWLFHGRYNPTLAWNSHVHRGGPVGLDAVSSLSPTSSFIELHGVEHGHAHSVRLQFEAFSSVSEGEEGANGSGASTPNPGDFEGLPFPVLGRVRLWLDGQEIVDTQNQAVVQTPKGGIAHPPSVSPVVRASGLIEGSLQHLEVSKHHVRRYSDVVTQGQKDEMLEVLRAVRPNVEDLEILIGPENTPYVSATTRRAGRRSLHDLGGGMVRLFRFLTDAFEAKEGILIVDEIENGFHYTALPKLWDRLKFLSDRLDVQLFVTTHSRECIQAAVSSFEDRMDELAVHGLYRVDTEDAPVRSTCFSGDTLEGALELDLDMR